MSDTPKKKWFAVMKAFPFNTLQVMGRPLQSRESDPKNFIPLFDTREQAVAWCYGSEALILEMEDAPDGR